MNLEVLWSRSSLRIFVLKTLGCKNQNCDYLDYQWIVNQSSQFLLLYFGAQGLHEATLAASVYSYCFRLSPSLNHYFSFLVYRCFPAPSRSSSSMSSWRVPTQRQFRGSNPSEGEIFYNRPDRSWGPSSLLYNRYRVFPRGKAAGAWRWPPTPSSAEVKERVSYTSTPFLSLRDLSRENFTVNFTFTFHPKTVSLWQRNPSSVNLIPSTCHQP
jgi:hypothetical protein